MFKIIKLKGGASIMKVIQRNKIKFKVFFFFLLKEKLGMREDVVKVVLEYQDKFPELLQDKGEGFCINGRKLHEQLVEDVKINKDKKVKGDKFTQWIKRRIDKYNFKENEDYICHSQNCETQRKDGQLGITVKKEYNITLEMAKQLCMIENNKIGLMCRKYFIIIEKTLRNYEEWDKVRNPQRENANKLKSELKLWAIRNHFDADYNALYSREFNLLNVCLTGLTALEIKSYIGFTDKQTREHLEIEINKALDFIQTFDINLIKLNKSFEDRSEMIKQICDITYPNLKFK